MTSYNNFQSENAKHSNSSSRTDIYNPAFQKTVESRGITEVDSFTRNLDKYMDFVSWARFFPDLWWDLITPETGGIRLDLDQRVKLRCLARFLSTYGVFPRGYGKTLLEIMSMYHCAVWFPDIDISMTAQTRENAARLVDEKHREIIKFYPMMANEIVKYSCSKDTVEIIFTSGGRIDVLANQQSTKGARRKRLNVEESAQLNNSLFQDVLEPVVNIPRRTIGKEGLINPEELNGAISFFTTSWFRGSDEFERNLLMVDEMAELKGKMVLGSDWQLACAYGRGETRSQLLDKKARLSPIFFALNYESKWVGATDGALVDINKVLNLRTIPKAEFKNDGKEEIILSMDVARSQSDSNNQSSIAILKIKRNKNGKIKNVNLINLVNLPNGLNFSAQTVELKKLKKKYKAKAVVIDGNGLGSAIIDEVCKETIDPITGDNLGCWDTMNTEHEPEMDDAEKIVFNLQAQGINSDIIVNFIDMVESNKLQLLIKKQDSGYDLTDTDYIKNNIVPHIQTDLLIEEVANLKLKQLNNGKYTVEQVTKKINRDRYSATAYGCYYIKTYEDNIDDSTDSDWDCFLTSGL